MGTYHQQQGHSVKSGEGGKQNRYKEAIIMNKTETHNRDTTTI